MRVDSERKVGASIITASEFGGDALTFGLAGTAGNYACESYFQAAIRSDPMIFFLPTYIPSMRLQRDLWREVRRTIQAIPHRDIGGVIPGTRIPLFVVAPSVAMAVASGDTIEHIREETERVIRNPGHAAGNVGRAVTEAPRRVIDWACYRYYRERGYSRGGARRKCD